MAKKLLKKPNKFKLHLELPAAERAEMAIMRLSQDPKFQTDYVISGPTPPEMIKRNDAINEQFAAERLKIIAKYDVVKKYAEPLLRDISTLRYALLTRTMELKALQSVCQHKRTVTKGKRRKCSDCYAHVH
jgi:hypothetical protein